RLRFAGRRTLLASSRAGAAGDQARRLDRLGGHARLRQPELAAGDDHGRAADLDALDLLRRSLDVREQLRGAADLGALRDLDLLAEGDLAVARQVQCQSPAADPVAGSSAIPPPGANIRVFHRAPEPAKQLIPRSGGRSSRSRSGRSRATSSSEPSET